MDQKSLAITYLLFVWIICEVSSKGCNKTIRTTRAVRSPKLTRANKNKPITCVYHFLGYGDKRSLNLFELNIRSFQVGKLVNGTTCTNGYLQIVDHRLRIENSGFICGKIRRSRTLLVESESVTLIFHTDYFTRRTFFKAQSSVLPQPLARERHKELAAKNPGNLIQGTYCDRTYVNCIGFCDVMSPGYPGVYPRNLTCRYKVIFNSTDVRVTIGGQYFDKFDVWGAPGFVGHRIVTYCPYDYIRIQDGLNPNSPTVGRFCGHGTLPRIVLKNPAMLLDFVASPAGSLLNDGFYLSVGFERRLQENSGEQISENSFQWTFESTDKPHGYFYSLRHWYPARTKCVYRFLGRHGERVWINFQGFNIRRGYRCRDKLLIFDASWPDTSRLIGGFCGHTRPNETMMSSGESLFIQFESIDGSYDGSQFEYSAYYMFVNSTPARSVVPDTECDQVFSSSSSTSGTFDILPNRLQLRRRQLKCQLLFIGRPTEQVRIILEEMRFDPVKQCVRVEKIRCADTQVDPLDHLVILEDDRILDCLCSDPPKRVEVVSSGSMITALLRLHNIHYLAHRETSSFIFRGKYEFLQVGCGQSILWGRQGRIDFPVYPDRLQEIIQCKWTIETSRDTHILVKFPRLRLQNNCNETMIKIYAIGQKSPYEKICDSSETQEILPPGWDSPTVSSSGHKIIIELTSYIKNISFSLRWTEIRRFEGDNQCDYVCRDNLTCLSSSLLCNGIINCPEKGYIANPLDESPSNCKPLDLFVYYLPASIALILSLFTTSFIFFYLWKKKETPTPRPK
ncbi:cubilin-like [Centruroides sculpturatus]|uniref:cubilin-like n=1 Tax=Centruroides sculpturatus TaxID=218467 RepID=UPI000C6EB01D|nr:cubilin-like [Centruroides sculpturatus]